MGQLIFILALVVELAFAAYCIVTKADQRTVRSYIRLGAFAVFVLLTLAAVIQWSSRWYLLALLLFIWAVLGALALIRKKPQESWQQNKQPYRAGRSVGRAVGTLLLIFIVLIPALIFPQYKLPPMTGTQPVATALYTYTDPSRVETFSKNGGNREVNVECWYPKDPAAGAKFPLVVFSHGTGGTKASNTSTFMDLASSGYVVCSIDHPYHSMVTVDADGRRTTVDPAYLQEYLAFSSGKYDDAAQLKLEQQWMGLRVADINFVLDTILQKAKDSSSGAVYQLIDPTKIGLMGHSLGGESAAEVARERVASGKNDIKAVINLDADLAGEYVGIQGGQRVINNTPFPVPILNIFSDSLWFPLEKIPNGNETIAVKHVIATSPNAYEMHIAGTNHLSFTDMPLISPFLVSMINSAVPKAGGAAPDPYNTLVKMNGIVQAFFNDTLKGEGTFSTAGLN